MKVMRAEKSCLHGGASSKRRGKKRAAGSVTLYSGFEAPKCPLISLRARSESCAFVARVIHSMPLFYWTTSSERWLMGNVAYRVWVSFGKVQCII
jgi:hypothetical protein